MNQLRELAYRIDPVLWVREVLGVEPAPWQQDSCARRWGASILVLTARQVGKTTAAAWAIAHFMLFNPGRLERDRLPRPTPECRSRAAGARDPCPGRRRTDGQQRLWARTEKWIAGDGAAGQR